MIDSHNKCQTVHLMMLAEVKSLAGHEDGRAACHIQQAAAAILQQSSAASSELSTTIPCCIWQCKSQASGPMLCIRLQISEKVGSLNCTAPTGGADAGSHAAALHIQAAVHFPQTQNSSHTLFVGCRHARAASRTAEPALSSFDHEAGSNGRSDREHRKAVAAKIRHARTAQLCMHNRPEACCSTFRAFNTRNLLSCCCNCLTIWDCPRRWGKQGPAAVCCSQNNQAVCCSSLVACSPGVHPCRC